MDNAAWLIQSVQQPASRSGQDLTPLGTLEIVALTAEYRRLASGSHNWRVAHLAALLAKEFGFREKDIEILKQAAPLHDIGTIFIPEQILRKPDKLSAAEMAAVQRHVELGSRLLQTSDSAVLQVARTIIENHHERFDGSGYPAGKRGAAIPLIAQIVALADVFDSLTHTQPYRQALSVAAALDILREARGKAFAAQLVDALLAVVEEHYWLVREGDKKQEVLLEGKLGTLNLFDLLASLAQNKTSGKLRLELEKQGFITLIEGRIVQAEVAEQSGEAALLVIFGLAETNPEAKFRLESLADKPIEATIHTASAQLLFDIAVKLDDEITKRNHDSQD